MRIFSTLHSRLLAIAAAAALCSSPLLAQQTLGGISGTVTDPNGGVIPNAAVTAVGEQTALTRTASTNGSGGYSFVNLPIGTYTLTYTAEGFQIQKTPHITVQADRTVTLNAQLKVAAAKGDTVVVEGSPLMNAVDTTVGYVLDKTQIEAVPLATGSFTGLATQSTGVSAEFGGGTGANSGLGNAPIWANGQRDTSNSFLLNGVDASNLFNGKSTSQVASARVINSTGVSSSTGAGGVIPSSASIYLSIGNAIPTPAPETIAEVRVNASMYDAQQGSTSGAHIDLSTASGTNNLHGTAYVHRGTSWLNAAPFFFNQDPDIPAYNKVPELHRYTAGGTVGGPLIKDKLFGFLSYQHLQESDQEIGDSVLDVPVGLSDDRSADGLANVSNNSFCSAYDQANFGCTPITAAQIDRTALVLFNSPALPGEPGKWLIPNDALAAANLPPPSAAHIDNAFIPGTGRFKADLIVGDLDYNASKKDTLSLKYFYQHDPTLSPYSYSSVPGFTEHLDSGAQVFSIINTLIVKSEPEYHADTGSDSREELRRQRAALWPRFDSRRRGGHRIHQHVRVEIFPRHFGLQRAGRLSALRIPDSHPEYRPQRGRPVFQYRHVPESPRSFGQRDLDPRQTHLELRRQLHLHAAQHDRQAHRHGHHCHRRLQPDGAGLCDARQFGDRLLCQLFPAGQRQPLLPRQPARHLSAGQVADHAEPLADRGRAL